MEEIKPFSEKPIDRSIALAIYNGTFVWHTTAKKTKAKKLSLYEIRFPFVIYIFEILLLYLYIVCYIVAIFSWDRICCCCRPNDTEKEVLTTLVQPKPIPVLISINLIVPKVFVVKKYQLTWCSLLKLYRLYVIRAVWLAFAER